ncbi:MAG: chloride channel protein [Mucilaginibacter sp.]|uniref:chloride channel protein n=1 Tax=Mucilaginibacter sp. TaxID=1882438 RepID=UPI0034E3CA48
MTDYTRKKKYVQFIRLLKSLKHDSILKAKSYEVILTWIRNNVSRSQFLLLSGVLVGLTSGLAGVLLKMLVHYIEYLIHNRVHFEEQIAYYIIFPVLGIVLTTLCSITFFSKEKRKGVPAILYEIAQNSSLVSSTKMYSQIVQSALTVGFGGSAGLESPIAVTGAAIGSNFAKTYKLDYRERTLLLAAGASAGIAAAFNAPMAGIMFAFEVLLTGVVFTDFVPLVVAAVCGSLLSKIILNEETLFQFRTRHPFDYKNIPYYIILGIFCGLYSRYYMVVSQHVEHFFKNLRRNRLQKALIGGLLLSLLCVLLPPLFGEGYQSVKNLASGQVETVISASFLKYFPYQPWFILLFLGCVCIFKVFATSITLNSGGVGGNFAPSLVCGGTLGFFLASVYVQLGFPNVPINNLLIVGMAGVMSGVMYAPLTAVFLIAESSSGYDLFIPLFIVSVISFVISKWFSPISPDLQKLADEGQIFTHEHDRNLLTLLHTPDLIETNVQTIDVNASFPDLLELVRQGHRNFIAVLENGDKLVGIITLDDIRPIMFNHEMYDELDVEKVMKAPPALVDVQDDTRTIIRKFDDTNNWNLPVVNGEKFVGFISKSTILNQYRELLKGYSA